MSEFPTVVSPRRRKRHPIRALLIALVVLVVLGVAAYLVAEPLARRTAENFVRVGIARQLGIANPDSVHVDLGDGSVILQAIQGRFDEIHVTIDHFSSGNVVGTAVLTATGVPLSTAKPLDTLRVALRIDEKDVRTLVLGPDDTTPTTVALHDSAVRLGYTLDILGARVPVSVDLKPTAARNNLVLEPTGITLGDHHYTARQLEDSPFGGLTRSLFAAKSLCVAGQLPPGLRLRGVAVAGDHLTVTLTGRGLALGSLGAKGTCTGG